MSGQKDTEKQSPQTKGEMNEFKFTDKQLTTIIDSLQSSIRRADEKAAEALRKNFHDANVEVAFYVDVKARCENALVVINKAGPSEDENSCPECGEDEGFCQCEEEDQ